MEMEMEIKMMKKIRDREKAMWDIASGLITQSEAARRLGLSRKWVNYLFKIYRRDGARALVSKRVGKSNTRKFTDDFKDCINKVVSEKIYEGFGPTLT